MKGSIATKTNKKKKVMAIMASLLVFSAQSAGAEEVIEFDDISVTASRVETKISETPASITTIDREEIDKVKFTDAKDLLDRIPGVSMVRNLRIPFGSKAYTLNLLDGMSVMGPSNGRTEFIEEVNTFDIERIEVVRGPASALYGSNALGGVINVITRDAPEIPEYRVWGEIGENKRRRGGLSAAGTTDGGLGYFADINFLELGGWRESTRHDREAGSIKLIHKPDDTSSLTFRAEYFEMFRESSGTLTEAEFEQDWRQRQTDLTDTTFGDTDTLTASVKYKKEIGAEADFEISYVMRDEDVLDNPTVSYKDVGETEDFHHNVVAIYSRNLGYMDSRVIAGVDLQRGSEESLAWDSWTDHTKVSGWDIESTVTSPFIQYEISPIEKTKITLGGRYDKTKYDADDTYLSDGDDSEKKSYSDFTSKAGITYEITPDNSVWFSYSEGFVAPGTSALFTASNPNRNLDPEEAQSYEIGLRGKMLDKKLNYDIALYDMDIEDMVVGFVSYPRGVRTTTYTNAGKVSIRGIETALGYKASKYLSFDVAHTYTKNKYDEYSESASKVYDGNDIAVSPDHHVNARVIATPMELLDVELEMDYISRYHTDSANTDSYRRPTLYNLRAAYDTGVWSCWLHVKNLTDRKYATRVSSSISRGSLVHKYYSGSPRSIYAGASYTW